MVDPLMLPKVLRHKPIMAVADHWETIRYTVRMVEVVGRILPVTGSIEIIEPEKFILKQLRWRFAFLNISVQLETCFRIHLPIPKAMKYSVLLF